MQESVMIYLVDQGGTNSDNRSISIHEQISYQEMDEIFTALRVVSYYHPMKQARDIVFENGKDFQDYMLQANLELLRQKKVSLDQLASSANKLALNYAASLKTYIDIEKRLLKEYGKKTTPFEELCSRFYDSSVEYRFWMNFRNYIVHYAFPYHGVSESYSRGVRILCTKEHLLRFDNWKQSKKDIIGMDDNIDLPKMVFEMSAMISALFCDFFSYFATEIISALTTYQAFCRKRSVSQPAFLETKEPLEKESFERAVNTSRMHVLPISDLLFSYEELKRNPSIRIVSKKEGL